MVIIGRNLRQLHNHKRANWKHTKKPRVDEPSDNNNHIRQISCSTINTKATMGHRQSKPNQARDNSKSKICPTKNTDHIQMIFPSAAPCVCINAAENKKKNTIQQQPNLDMLDLV